MISHFSAEQIIVATTDPIFVLDSDCTIKFVNPAACALFDASEEELLDTSIRALAGTSPWLGAFCELLNAGTGESGSLLIPYINDRYGARLLNFSSSIMADQDGQPVATVYVARDTGEDTQEREVERSAQGMSTLYDIGLYMGSTLSASEVIQRTAASIEKLMSPDTYYVALYDDGTETVSFEHVVIMDPGPPPGRRMLTLKKPLSEGGVTGHIIRSREPLLVRDWLVDGVPYEGLVIRVGTLNRSMLSVPMFWQDKVIGVISAQCLRPNAFDVPDQRLFEAMAAQTAIALENSRLHKLAQDQAQLDSLTQVYNHGYFVRLLNNAVQVAEASDTLVALIMLDIDHFKHYNDTYGHIVGDNVLNMVAGVLKSNARDTDAVGRWGGEEFGLLMPGVDIEEAQKIARRIQRAIARLTPVDGHENRVPGPTVSQGISSYPYPSSCSLNLIEQADAALYYAKQQGRNKVAFSQGPDILKTVPLTTAPLLQSR